MLCKGLFYIFIPFLILNQLVRNRIPLYTDSMTSLQITETKNFMTKLLCTDCFDSFLLEEASISAANTFTIDGRMNPSFFTAEEWEDPDVRPYPFSSWEAIRPICFSLIRGKRTPVAFKFVLHLKPEYVRKISEGLSFPPETVQALVLTIRYENGRAQLITGTAFTTFVMDKSLDALWDSYLRRFLDQKGIGYDT